MLFRIRLLQQCRALCFEWIKHFERFTTTRQHSKWRLLLFYATVGVRTAQKSSLISAIITTSFYPHTTHLVQPLDLICFQPYNHFNAEAVGVARRTFNKLKFFVALSTIREQTFKRTTIPSAFRQTRLISLSELPATTPSLPGTPPLTASPSPKLPPSLFAHSNDKRRSSGTIATLPALPVSKGSTHTLLVALHKHKSPGSRRVCAHRLLNWHERLSEQLATGLPKRVVFSLLQRQGTKVGPEVFILVGEARPSTDTRPSTDGLGPRLTLNNTPSFFRTPLWDPVSSCTPLGGGVDPHCHIVRPK